MSLKIAVIGEFNSHHETHTTIDQALNDLAVRTGVDIAFDWIDTTKLENDPAGILSSYHGIWSAPGSPFKSLTGALNAIRYARENNIPHLGTCAGFQHTVIELARDMLGFPFAQHEEYDAESSELFISRLACSLAGKTLPVKIIEGTRSFDCYQCFDANENYYCNFGLNPAVRDKLTHPDLIFSGVDQDNEIRILELKNHAFFIATVFVPQTRSTLENPHPLILGFIMAAIKRMNDLGSFD